MDWQDDGIVLAARKHGENSAIVSLLTRQHGRHAGLVRGGSGRRARGLYQPGNLVAAHWKARLPEHLGTYRCEMTDAVAAGLLNEPAKLAGLSSACAVAEAALPERQSHQPVFDGLLVLLEALDGPSWPSVYVKWELGLLQELGFGLDLSRCAATGTVDDLVSVSPKSGRAVSRAAAAPYKDVLLPLPRFLLISGETGSPTEITEGLALTAYFFERHVFGHRRNGMPAARRRLAERLQAGKT